MAAAPDGNGKPTLVYFQRRFDARRLVQYVQLHYRQQIKCLEQFFRVHVVNEDCDYDRICDTYWPDITLFDSGISCEGYRRLSITNTSAHRAIPKVGFYNADSFCRARAAFLSDMDQWGIETIFSISVSLAEYLPDIARNLFVWPNFIDPDVYRDYQCPKTIPILFTGSSASYYPWRRRIQHIVSRAYPSLLSPHLGYDRQKEERIVYGESYARMLNACWFVPSCGTVANDVVRKHFEIPGSRSCLLAQKSAGLTAAGFVDMRNCVFAEDGDVLDKMDYLFRNQERLREITDAGYRLVHSRHVLRARDQILRWLRLKQHLQPGQRIIQRGPFGPLCTVADASTARTEHVAADGVDRAFLHQGNAALWDGRYDEAIRLFMKSLNTIMEIPLPEPQLGLALCHLFKGEPQRALQWLVGPLQCVLVTNDTRDPDPVEWAYFLIALLCDGSFKKASRCGKRFPWLRHPELDRARWLLEALNGGGRPLSMPAPKPSGTRASVHGIPVSDGAEWRARVCRMLTACGQLSAARQLQATAG